MSEISTTILKVCMVHLSKPMWIKVHYDLNTVTVFEFSNFTIFD